MTKKLLPELLPDPTLRGAPGGPRQRTLQRLLTLAATGATLGACSKTPTSHDGASTAAGQRQPEGTVATVEVAPPTDAGDDSAPVPSRVTSAQPTATAPPPPPTGYAVVDPMPPPARCAGLAQTVNASARWRGGVIEVRLPKPGMSGATYNAGAAPRAWSGTIKHHAVTSSSALLDLVVPSGATNAGAVIAATCPQGVQHVNIIVSATGGGPLKPGTPLRVSLADQY